MRGNFHYLIVKLKEKLEMCQNGKNVKNGIMWGEICRNQKIWYQVLQERVLRSLRITFMTHPYFQNKGGSSR